MAQSGPKSGTASGLPPLRTLPRASNAWSSGTRTKPTASSEQVLVLQDAVARLQVVLEADLPAEAYQALVALDLSAFQQGPVHYDRQRGRWRSELDEWQQRQG